MVALLEVPGRRGWAVGGADQPLIAGNDTLLAAIAIEPALVISLLHRVT